MSAASYLRRQSKSVGDLFLRCISLLQGNFHFASEFGFYMEELKPRTIVTTLFLFPKWSKFKETRTRRVTYDFQIQFIDMGGSLFEVHSAPVGSLVRVFHILQRQIWSLVFSSKESSTTKIPIIVPMFSKGLDVLTYIIAATVNGGMRDSFEKLLIDPFAQFKVNKERFML